MPFDPLSTLAGLFAGGCIVKRTATGVSVDPNPLKYDQVEANQPYSIQVIDVDVTVSTAQLFEVQGDQIYVVHPDAVKKPVYIQLNDPGNPQIELTAIRKITGTFKKFYITSSALNIGNLRLIVTVGYAIDLAESLSASKEGEPLTLSLPLGLAGWNASLLNNFVVPKGVTYMLEGFSICSYSAAVATYTNPHWVTGGVTMPVTSRIVICGNGGASITFPSFKPFYSGETIEFWVTNRSNHNCLISGDIWGYKILT
jgi:hypothetical protein